MTAEREKQLAAARCEWSGPDKCEHCKRGIGRNQPVYCFMDGGEQPEPTYVGTCCVGIFLGDPCTHTFKGERCTRCGEFTDEFYEREGQKWDELAARMNCPPQDEQP